VALSHLPKSIDNSSDETSDSLDLMECVDYVGGFSDGMGSTPLFCPGDATTGTIIRAYVLFMRDHPKRFDNPRRVGFLEAMQRYFPCKLSNKPK
jgi:hypothetical protein